MSISSLHTTRSHAYILLFHVGGRERVFVQAGEEKKLSEKTKGKTGWKEREKQESKTIPENF